MKRSGSAMCCVPPLPPPITGFAAEEFRHDADDIAALGDEIARVRDGC